MRVDLSQVKTEFVEVRDRRQALAPPPFIQDRALWARAIEVFKRARSCGQLPGEPFVVLTNVYRSLGGDFR
jgi:hypothetical protein